jgi:hypothetical protein
MLCAQLRVVVPQLIWRCLDVGELRWRSSSFLDFGIPAFTERQVQASAARTKASRSSDASTFG